MSHFLWNCPVEDSSISLCLHLISICRRSNHFDSHWFQSGVVSRYSAVSNDWFRPTIVSRSSALKLLISPSYGLKMAEISHFEFLVTFSVQN